MQQSPVTDIVTLAIFIAALIFSGDVATVVGPYMLIVAAAAVGASFTLARHQRVTRLRAVWFFARVCGLAVLLTAALSSMVATYLPALSDRTLLAPVAFALGLVGDDVPAVARWAVRKLNALIDVMIKLRGGGGS